MYVLAVLVVRKKMYPHALAGLASLSNSIKDKEKGTEKKKTF